MTIDANIWRYFLIVLVLVLAGLFVNTEFSHAQFGSTFNQASLITSPSSPRPNALTTISLDAYAYDLSAAQIRWFLDGVEQSDSRNDRSMEFTTGNIGTTYLARAEISLSGSPLVLTKRITPGDVDIILEADTQTPIFYKGRALPSGGSTVRAIAIPSLKDVSSVNNLVYAWNLGSNVLNGGARLGANTVTFQMPRSNALLSVSVSNVRGEILSEKIISITPSAPVVNFYKYSPLQGLSRTAIIDAYPLIAEEVSVRAETYFVDRIDSPQIVLTWSDNGNAVTNGNTDRRLITLRKVESAYSTLIGFEFVNPQKFGQIARGSFPIFFE